MRESLLPNAFAELEPFVGWALGSETQRNNKRLASTLVEITAFVEAILPRIEEVAQYIDQHAQNAVPAGSAQRLLDMLLSLAEVAPVIESYGQAEVVDGYDSRKFVADNDHRLRPKLAIGG